MAKTVLIVEDSASMRQMISFTLKDAGYDVVIALNGKDAMAKIGAIKADLIITDLNMPEMNGIELIRQLRAKAGYKFIPIVMLTTESQEEKQREGKQAGASCWLVKPFQPAQLVDIVKKFIK